MMFFSKRNKVGYWIFIQWDGGKSVLVRYKVYIEDYFTSTQVILIMKLLRGMIEFQKRWKEHHHKVQPTITWF